MLCYERRVIHLEFLHRIFHLRVFIGLDRKNSCEDIWSDTLESCDRILGFDWSSEYRISHARFRDRLESCYHIADLSFIESCSRRILRTKTSHFESFDLGACIYEFEFISFFYLPREELQVYYYSLVWIILRVEDESLHYPLLVVFCFMRKELR